MLRSLAPFLSFVALSHAYTVFETVCSTPSVAVNYVSSADTRGTLDILWSCLFTIIACTWTVQHLNVPEQREGRDRHFWGDVKWGIKRGLTSAKWMLATVIAPEILLSKYSADLLDAKIDLKKMSILAVEDGVPWELGHCLFANMGGFVLRTRASGRVGYLKSIGCQTVPEIADAPAKQETSQELSKANQANALLVATSSNSEGSDPQESSEANDFSNPYHLKSDDIFALRESGVLTRLPYITLDELQDRSKSDGLVRTIAIVQILWISIQILARAARHLAISQLEIAVIAFASCAVVMYGLNWFKPKGVQVPITILQYSGEAPKTVLRVLSASAKAETEQSPVTVWIVGLRTFLGRPAKSNGAPVSNAFTRDLESLGTILGLILGSFVFGGIHLAAWKFQFPTKTEQVLWWSTSLWCTCFTLTFYVCIFFLAVPYFVCHWLFLLEEPVITIGTVLLLSTYALARLFLLVEIFRTLWFLPPDAYVATWASNVPHIS